MDAQTDAQLLRAYAERRSDAAFAALVRRHIDLVHSAARRMVCDAHLAEDVTQATFLALAKNAAQLTERPVLAGWLHRTAQNIAAQTVRTDVRRRAREQEAAAMNELLADSGTGVPPDWSEIAPHLDAALGDLTEPERDAVLLRYFERKSAREMAQTLGISDEAAQKRVSRAVERLREFFAKRGVTVGASGLAVVISANAVQAAPVGLALTISTAAALTGTTLASTATVTAIKTLAMTTIQKTIVTATIAVLAGAGIYEARQTAQLRTQIQTLQQAQAEQIQRLQGERDETTARLADLLAENSRLKSNPNQAELLRLRGEVTALRTAANDPTQKAMQTVAAKVKLLRQLLEQRPDKTIPELQFVTDKVWANIAWNADLETEDGIRVAFSNLRGEAENIFLNEMLHGALKKYLAANNDILPADLSALKSYFDVSVTDAMLGRYELLQTGKPNSTADLVKLAAYTDPDYDSFHMITLNGASGGGFNRNQDAINDAAREFARVNNYQAPTNPAQIAPFLHKAIDAATIQKYLNQFVVDPPSSDEAVMAPVLSAYFNAHNGVRPNKASDLLPYITTPEQQAVFQKLENGNPSAK